MGVGEYIHTKKVPSKFRVREDLSREPVNLKLIAQALHLNDIDIASSQQTGSDEKGPFATFHPKPYGVDVYRADPGKIESSTADLDDVIAKLAQRLKKEGGRGPMGSDPFTDLFR